MDGREMLPFPFNIFNLLNICSCFWSFDHLDKIEGSDLTITILFSFNFEKKNYWVLGKRIWLDPRWVNLFLFAVENMWRTYGCIKLKRSTWVLQLANYSFLTLKKPINKIWCGLLWLTFGFIHILGLNLLPFLVLFFWVIEILYHELHSK